MPTNYIASGDGSFLDPVSNKVVPGMYMTAGAVYGWYRNKDKDLKTKLMWAAIWGLAARLAPVPTALVGAYKEGLHKQILGKFGK